MAFTGVTKKRESQGGWGPQEKGQNRHVSRWLQGDQEPLHSAGCWARMVVAPVRPRGRASQVGTEGGTRLAAAGPGRTWMLALWLGMPEDSEMSTETDGPGSGAPRLVHCASSGGPQPESPPQQERSAWPTVTWRVDTAGWGAPREGRLAGLALGGGWNWAPGLLPPPRQTPSAKRSVQTRSSHRAPPSPWGPGSWTCRAEAPT